LPAEQEKYPRRDPTTAYRSVADEGYLVVVPTRATVEVLNPVGGRIFSMLDGQHTEEDVVRAIVDEFEVAEAQARRDVRAFLEDLRGKGMLAIDGGNGATAGESADE